MKKICFITGTRADYGIMSRLMDAVKNSDWATLQIIATNMHLSPEFGMTVNEIKADGFNVDRCVDMKLSKIDSPVSRVKSMSVEMEGIAEAFDALKPDLAVILGDRYEMLVAATAAIMCNIPIAHLHGGEITEGAIDDKIRNAITQLSDLHIAATEEYSANITAMLKSDANVYNTGALGVENIRLEKIIPLKEMNQTLKLDFEKGKYLLVTFHPVTMQPGDEETQTKELLWALEKAMEYYPELKILITMPNSDSGGNTIRRIITDWTAGNYNRVETVESLGKKRYYCALQNCAAVVGNSSSGLIEAPEFGVPTVNIGIRQKGRAQGNSVTNCDADSDAILGAVISVLKSKAVDKETNHYTNPYRGERTCESILEILHDYICR